MLVVPPSGQNWNQWSVQFEFSSGAIWWENLELMLVVSSGQNWNQYGVFNLNCPFYWIFLLCSWRDKSSYRSNAWVRCASGNVFWEYFETHIIRQIQVRWLKEILMGFWDKYWQFELLLIPALTFEEDRRLKSSSLNRENGELQQPFINQCARRCPVS